MVIGALYVVASHLKIIESVSPGRKLSIQSLVVNGKDGNLTSAEALARISTSSLPKRTNLGSTTLNTWFSSEKLKCPETQLCTLEIRGLRSEESSFWWVGDDSIRNPKLTPLTPGQFQSTSLGVTISIPSTRSDSRLLALVKPKTSRPITLFVWEANELKEAENLFERNGGILFGSLFALAFFSAVISIMHRDLPFLLLAGWLILTLRLAAINGGWDLYWLGLDPSVSTNLIFTRLTLGMYGLLSAAVFLSLFGKTLVNWQRRILQTTAYLFIGITLASPFMAHNTFVAFFRPAAGVALVIAVVTAARQIRGNTREGAILFLSSWLAIAVGASIDILFSTGLITERPAAINLQSSAIAAGFIMAIALANRMKLERNERLAAERAATAALSRFRENYNKVPVGLFSMKQSGEIHAWNPRFEELFCVKREENVSWSSLFPSAPLDKAYLENEQRFECSVRKGDYARWFEVQLVWRDQCFEGTLGAEKLEYAAHFDQLTGLRNRTSVIESIENFLTIPIELRSENRCLILLDIDGFHQVVTYFGHAAGDKVLQTVKDRILSSLPIDCVVGRLSADTFAIVVSAIEIDEAGAIAQQLLNSISETPFSSSNKSFAIRARAGVVCLNEKNTSSLALAACDAALQEAKHRGSGCIVIYRATDPALLAHEAETILMTQFREKIPFDRMHLVYQPIVSLSTPTKSMSYESLLRLTDSTGKIVSPGLFIPALEKNGMMSQIDRWVVREVFRHLEDNPIHTSFLTYVSVNLSGASLNDEKFILELLELAAQHPLTINKICFEITESIALADIALTTKFVRSVKALGAKIALDDFGAGYSSFGYLTAIEADYLKIDGILVKNLQESATNFAVVKAISELGVALNMTVIAEWVENEEILTSLLQLKVASGQGWALSKPMLSEEIAKYRSGADFCKNESIRGLLKLPAIDIDNPVQLFSTTN
jgi:diguanylate cyclase (GGDEF)-like protein